MATVILSADSFLFLHCSLGHEEEGSSILVDIILSLGEIASVQISLTFALPYTSFLSLDILLPTNCCKGAVERH